LARVRGLLHQDDRRHSPRRGASRAAGRHRGTGRRRAGDPLPRRSGPRRHRPCGGTAFRFGDRRGGALARHHHDPPEGPRPTVQSGALPAGAAAGPRDVPQGRPQRGTLCQGRVAGTGPRAQRLHGPAAVAGQGGTAAHQGDRVRDPRGGAGRTGRADPPRRRWMTAGRTARGDTATLVVGVDIGNSTTEACVAELGVDGPRYLGGALAPTSGVKGTAENVPGVVKVVHEALSAAGRSADELATVLVNEATPVISGLAMETITETIITESTMSGHNPDTPGGAGLGVGTTVAFAELADCPPGEPVVCVVGAGVDFEDAAAGIDAAVARGVAVTGAVVRADDANLIVNRLSTPIPVVDEVTLVEKVPLGMPAAVEVAEPGRTVRTLSNSYGIATLFELTPEQTRMVAPVARALVGNRSAVVVRTPHGDIADRRIPAGTLTLIGEHSTLSVGVDAGAEEIMATLRRVAPLSDATGESGTHVGGMLAAVRDAMTETLADAPDTHDSPDAHD